METVKEAFFYIVFTSVSSNPQFEGVRENASSAQTCSLAFAIIHIKLANIHIRNRSSKTRSSVAFFGPILFIFQVAVEISRDVMHHGSDL